MHTFPAVKRPGPRARLLLLPGWLAGDGMDRALAALAAATGTGLACVPLLLLLLLAHSVVCVSCWLLLAWARAGMMMMMMMMGWGELQQALLVDRKRTSCARLFYCKISVCCVRWLVSD
jgi:hypothetical protein